MELIKKGVFPEEAGKEELSRIINGIAVAKLEVSENLIDRNELEVLLNQAELFLTNLEPLYMGFSPTNKRRFLTKIFPEGILFNSSSEVRLRTIKKSLLFEFIDETIEEKSEKNNIMTLRGSMSNPIVKIYHELETLISIISRTNFNYNLAI